MNEVATHVERSDIQNQPINAVFEIVDSSVHGFDNRRCIVAFGEKLIELNSDGVDGPKPLLELAPCDLPMGGRQIYHSLYGLRILNVVVSDYLPTYGLLVEGNLLLHCSDLGPPFNAFGPLIATVGADEFYKISYLNDYWTRLPLDD